MNTSAHPLRCRCGALQGTLANARHVNHAVCYCSDCQAFAHYLGNPSQILDARGGSDIVQTQPKNLIFTQGSEQLACIRLTPGGLLRWYSRCCRTPVGNTLATPKLSFIGLLHCCLGEDAASLQKSFGPVTAWVHTDGARESRSPRTGGWAARSGGFCAARSKPGSTATTAGRRYSGWIPALQWRRRMC